MSTDAETSDNPGPRIDAPLRPARWVALGLGLLGLAATAAGLIRDPEPALRGYLVGFFFVLGFPIGALGLVLLHHLVGGDWGEVVRGPLEAAMMTLPVVVLAFLPVAFGVSSIYPWAGPEAHEVSGYLTAPLFWIRAFVYFAFWASIALWLYWESPNYHAGLQTPGARRVRKVAAPGFLVFFLTTTFAYVDWGMSLDPHWLSTIWGLMILVGHVLLALAGLLVFVAFAARSHDPFADALSPGRLRDLGNLLLVFVVLWAYTSFSQYIIIWSGDKVHEITWYLSRTQEGWSWVPAVLAALHFFVPLFALLFRSFKQHLTLLASLAGGLVVLRLLDTVWLLAPSFGESLGAIPWTTYTSTLGLGGLVVAAWLWLIGRRPLFEREHLGRSTPMETGEVAHVPRE